MKRGIKICIEVVLSVVITLGAAWGALAMNTPVQELSQSCVYSGIACAKVSDATSGGCRTIEYNTPSGPIKAKACDKGGWYELYRQTAPAGLQFKACVGGGCVDQNSGFTKFTSTMPISSTTTATSGTSSTSPSGSQISPTTSTGSVTTPVSSAPTSFGTGPYLISPESAGFGGETRAANYQRLVSALAGNPNVVQTVPCSQGTCLWVPWYKSSSSCTQADLMGGANCNLGTINGQSNCMVTDEFSQVGMVIAMSDDQTRMDQFYNTVKALKSTKYGSLPVWKASRSSSGINSMFTGNQDDASDATARIIIALYVGASSDHFSASSKANYKALADTLSADMVKYDFNHVCRPGRNGLQICNWLASGAASGSSGLIGTTDFSYAGYYGDVMLALLAAYKSTGDPQYMSVARDTAEAYLLASSYNGQHISVPPKAFKWDTSAGTPKAVCTNYCQSSLWDDSDAPRAVSVCKALHYAKLNGLSLDTDLGKYCDQWVSSPGVAQNKYAIQYYFNGNPLGSPQGGYYQNGLGSYLNFYAKQEDLRYKLDEALSHYTADTKTFDKASCMGVYRSAFPIVSLGSAIGRDTKAFGASGSTATSTVKAAATEPVATAVEPTATQTTDAAADTTADAAPAITPTATSGTPAMTPTTTPKLSASSLSVAALSVVSHEYTNGPASKLVSDVTSKGCRTVVYTNDGTYTQVYICAKDEGYDMYLQTPKTNGPTVTCVGTSCVGPKTAFAHW